MRRKLWSVVVLFPLLFALAACDGRSGSSGVRPSGATEGSYTTTVKAKVALSYGSARAPVTPMAVDPIEEAYQSATVTLTLPDSRSFLMSYDGNGLYSCVVQNLPDGVAGYIEAQINDMVLKAFFDGLFAQQNVLDTGEVGADSTFAADVLTSFAETLAGSSLDVSDILSGVTDATLAIDIQAVNEVVNDGQTVGYELARRTYESVLTWDNINLDANDISGLIASSPNVTDLFTQIESGVFVPPAAGGPVVEAKAFAAQFIESFYNTRTDDSLLAFLAPDNFMWSGLDVSGFSGRATSMWNGEALFTTLSFANFTKTIYSVTPVADFTSQGRSMYLITLQGTYDVQTTGDATITRSWDGILKKFYAAKISTLSGDRWVTFGDRRKSTFDCKIAYFNATDPGRFAEITAQTVFGGEMPVSVTARLGSGAPMAVSPSVTSAEEFAFKIHGGPLASWEYQSGAGATDTGITYVGIDSMVLAVTATFADSSTETFQKVIEIQSPMTVVTSFVQNPGGSVSVGWRPPTTDERLLRVDVVLPRHGLTFSLPPSTRALTIAAVDLSTAGVQVGVPDHIDVIYVTPTAQYGFREFFSWNGVP